MVEKASPANEGAWLDGSVRGRFMNADIIEEAIAWGYQPSPGYFEIRDEGGRGAVADWEFAYEEADDATDWMNDHVAPPGFFFADNPDWGDWGLYWIEDE
jgi:hypothetical protein